MMKKVILILIWLLCEHLSADIIIGEDDFDGTNSYLSRINSAPINVVGAVWDIVSRSTVDAGVSAILDTSKYSQSGTAGDGTDTVGFIESTKTDNFFGMYRGGLTTGRRTLTYTFNVSGASDLNLAMDWAASGDVIDQGIAVTAWIDGGATQTLFQVVYSTDDSATVMEDGRVTTAVRSGYIWVNGIKTAMLTDNFSTYLAAVSGTGSVLTVSLSMTGTSSASGYGIDNLVLYSESATQSVHPGGFSFALISAKTPSDTDTSFYCHVPYGSDPAQIMNFWKAESDHPTPVVFSIHGGGWHGGAMEEELNGSYYNRGVSYCSIEYRMINRPDILLPVPVLDAARALQFLRSKAAEWNIDKNRIVLTGGSAGACTSMWLAFHDDLADPESADPVARESTRVQGAYLVNGQTTLDPFLIRDWIGMDCVNHLMIWDSVGASSGDDLLANWDRYQELSRQFSPINYLDAGDPPVYIKYGLSAALPPTDSSHAIHHPMFGIKLKEKADTVGAACYLEADGQPRPPLTAAQYLDSLLLNRL